MKKEKKSIVAVWARGIWDWCKGADKEPRLYEVYRAIAKAKASLRDLDYMLSAPTRLELEMAEVDKLGHIINTAPPGSKKYLAAIKELEKLDKKFQSGRR